MQDLRSNNYKLCSASEGISCMASELSIRSISAFAGFLGVNKMDNYTLEIGVF